jgi:hypothetical protein
MMMSFQMFRMGRQECQILDPVVQSVAVDVVDNFPSIQSPTEVLFHDESVFQWASPSFDEHHSVAIVTKRARSEWCVLSNGRVTVSPPHRIMIRAVTRSDAPFPATLNGTVGSHLLDNGHRVTVIPPPDVVFPTPTSAENLPVTILDGTGTHSGKGYQ